jgi:integrating conjugative element membrane protein (TIGR03747 family)
MKVISIRLFIFILSFPLWLSVLFVMIVDGLVQRDIRKFQAARESTFLFHRLKLLTENLFYSFFLIYMSMPIAIQPEALLLPTVIIVSVLFKLSIKYYKKYV